MAKADRIAEILGADDVLEERPGAYRGGRAAGDVALEHVSFAYDRVAARAARRLAARSRPASASRSSGPSGAGKSTLGALVARFHDPTEGRVLIDGRDARDCALEWLRGAGRDPAPGHRAVHGHRARQHRLRLRRERRGDRRRGARRGRARLHLRAAGGLRHRARPAGRRALRRPAPAHRHRPHAAARPADPAARRADHRARRGQRGAAARRAEDADARAHDDPRQPLAAAHAARRPRRDDRARPRVGRPRPRRSTRRCRSSSGCSTRTRWPRCSTARSSRRSAT